MGTRNLLAIAAIASVAAIGQPAAAHTRVGVRIGVPYYLPSPFIVHEQVQVAPVWTPGHWEWQGDGHVWVPGYLSYAQQPRVVYRY